MATGSNSRDWQMWLQLLWRRRYYIVASIVVALAGGLYYALTTDPEYQSLSTVMIVDSNPLSGSQLRFVPGQEQRDEVDFFRRRIGSEGFLLKLVDSTDIRHNKKLTAKINQLCMENPLIERKVIEQQVYLEHLQKQIGSRMRAYNLIEISAKGPTSEAAFHLASLVTNLAIAETKRSEIKTVSDASSFTSSQLEIYRKRLDDAESRLSSFNVGITDQVLSESQLSPEKLTEMQSVKLSTEIDLQAKRDQMQKLLNGSLGSVSRDYQSQLDRDVSDLKQRMLKRTADVCELLKKFNWRDVEIIVLNEEIGQMKRSIYDRIREFLMMNQTDLSGGLLNSLIRYEEMRVETAMLQRTVEILQNIIREHNESIRRQPTQESYRSKLEREVLVNREIYETMLQTARGSQIAESAVVQESQTKFRLLSAPQRPLERVKPKRTQAMIFALGAGLGLGFGLVMLREMLDISVRTVADVSQHLNLPVLATIPKIESTEEKIRRKRQRLAIDIGIPLAVLTSLMLVYHIFFH